MKYFNGFSLRGEETLLAEWLDPNPYTVAGFSYGAVQAFRHAWETEKRVDLLQLLSPAFFQEKSEKFLRLQTLGFRKDRQAYLEAFLSNTAFPAALDLSSHLAPGTEEELADLLSFRWEGEKLAALVERGVRIEVYLGGKDRITDPDAAKRFFQPYATVYYVKEAGHLLLV